MVGKKRQAVGVADDQRACKFENAAQQPAVPSIVQLRPTEATDFTAACLLWHDIRSIFRRRGVDRISSLDLIGNDLSKFADRPWTGMSASIRDAAAIAALLRPLLIRPTVIRFGQRPLRGYHRRWFRDVPGCCPPNARRRS
jgi:hypothetical protein